MTPELIARIEKITGEPAHRFIRRGMFFCHRELDICLDLYEKK
jgi:tryptophanyl-tRNA synthetase